MVIELIIDFEYGIQLMNKVDLPAAPFIGMTIDFDDDDKESKIYKIDEVCFNAKRRVYECYADSDELPKHDSIDEVRKTVAEFKAKGWIELE